MLVNIAGIYSALFFHIGTVNKPETQGKGGNYRKIEQHIIRQERQVQDAETGQTVAEPAYQKYQQGNTVNALKAAYFAPLVLQDLETCGNA